MILMALSNAEGHLVLTTGNKSELATGYSTLYGDSAGGYAPIKDVTKTLVWELARWRNEAAAARGETPPIPENSITKPPSAELRPGQLDSDSLPDYAVLDAILTTTWNGTWAWPRWWPPGTTRSWPAGWCSWSTGRSTSGASTRRAPRSPRRTSAGTGGCRSRRAGTSRCLASLFARRGTGHGGRFVRSR